LYSSPRLIRIIKPSRMDMEMKHVWGEEEWIYDFGRKLEERDH
jgi:hypothetical protein